MGRLAASAQTDASVIEGVVNAASYSSPVAVGSIVSIFGSNLATVTQSASSDESPLPFSLGGTSVSCNGIPAPLFFVSPRQINAQVPWSIKAGTATLSAAETVVATSAGSGAPFPVSVGRRAWLIHAGFLRLRFFRGVERDSGRRSFGEFPIQQRPHPVSTWRFSEPGSGCPRRFRLTELGWPCRIRWSM